jgi:two-component system, sensor histidine kinase and response regulator
MLDLNLIEFNPRDNIEETIRVLALAAHQKGLELVCDIDRGVPTEVVGDALRIRQILVNLIGNAIRFTEKGEVVVGVKARALENPSNFELLISVRDTGIGIRPEKQEVIFQAFTQADNSITRQHGGTGLGLTISKRLVEMMGGRIFVESEYQRGSTFAFTTPVSVAGRQPHATTADFTSLQGVPVLVVDDNATNRRVLADWLSHWGMWPIMAESGSAALKLLDSLVEPVPLVLTDVHMPEMDGFELIARIKSQAQTPTVIMLTSGGYAGDVARSRELGAEAYLIKPVRRNDLLETILRILTAHPPTTHMTMAGRDSLRKLGRELRAHTAGGLRILVAEDNLINQKYAVHVLENEGYSVVMVGNSREAIAALGREAFDLVLMDVHMPEMDGFEATSQIRARERFTGVRTPIVAMTAHAMSGDRDKCLASGMDGYVAKPIRKAELMQAINSVVPGRVMPDPVVPAVDVSPIPANGQHS